MLHLNKLGPTSTTAAISNAPPGASARGPRAGFGPSFIRGRDPASQFSLTLTKSLRFDLIIFLP
jgi:hypothetical protein